MYCHFVSCSRVELQQAAFLYYNEILTASHLKALVSLKPCFPSMLCVYNACLEYITTKNRTLYTGERYRMTCIKLDTTYSLSLLSECWNHTEFCSFFFSSSCKNIHLGFCETWDSRGDIKLMVFWYRTPCRLVGIKVSKELNKEGG
jgi:hypothetical protein